MSYTLGVVVRLSGGRGRPHPLRRLKPGLVLLQYPVILRVIFSFPEIVSGFPKEEASLCELKNLRRSLHSTWNRSGRHFLPYYSSFRFIYLKQAIALQITLDPGITYYSCFCLEELKASCVKSIGCAYFNWLKQFS